MIGVLGVTPLAVEVPIVDSEWGTLIMQAR